MVITINIDNWKRIPQELAVNFVLGKIQDKINGGGFDKRMYGNHYDENGVEYRVQVKGL